MTCLIIYNPTSGTAKTPEQLEEITSLLKQKYEKVELLSTLIDKTATEIAKENLNNFDTFVVLGGDGTFSETLRSVAGVENAPILGYIPCGTVNDLALSHNIPFDYKKAVQIILDHNVVRKGALYINGIAASSLITAGMFTSSSYTAKSSLKKKIGKVAYYLEILFHDQNRDGKQLEITLNDDESTTYNALHTFVAFLNSRTVGGLKLNTQTFKDNDTIYAILCTRKKGFFSTIACLASMAKCLIKKIDKTESSKYVSIQRINKASVKAFSQITWNLDGEKGPDGNAEIVYKKDQFSFIVPLDY